MRKKISKHFQALITSIKRHSFHVFLLSRNKRYRVGRYKYKLHISSNLCRIKL
jgi:predicted HAD superfamily phosphohydrolase YqeG